MTALGCTGLYSAALALAVLGSLGCPGDPGDPGGKSAPVDSSGQGGSVYSGGPGGQNDQAGLYALRKYFVFMGLTIK